MNINTLKYLIDCEIFSITNYATTYTNAIQFKEIAMSRRIIEKGWNIGCLMNYYSGVDFTFKHKNHDEYDGFFLHLFSFKTPV
jgi:hypothetical protein